MSEEWVRKGSTGAQKKRKRRSTGGGVMLERVCRMIKLYDSLQLQRCYNFVKGTMNVLFKGEELASP